MKVITDHKWKQFKYQNEVPKKVLIEQFEHLSEESTIDGFLKYKNNWYHISDFMSASKQDHPWHGYTSDTVWSGVMIEVSDNGEEYRIGYYVS